MRPPYATCEHCQIPLADPESAELFCDLCRSMLRAIEPRRWFQDAQAEWNCENSRRADEKRRLMNEGFTLPEQLE